ncbi:MAG: hypothetical protein WDZ41_00345 [Candidatus Babeliales bacterium]
MKRNKILKAIILLVCIPSYIHSISSPLDFFKKQDLSDQKIISVINVNDADQFKNLFSTKFKIDKLDMVTNDKKVELDSNCPNSLLLYKKKATEQEEKCEDFKNNRIKKLILYSLASTITGLFSICSIYCIKNLWQANISGTYYLGIKTGIAMAGLATYSTYKNAKNYIFAYKAKSNLEKAQSINDFLKRCTIKSQ